MCVYCNGWNGNMEQPNLEWINFIYFCLRKNMNVHFTVGKRHRRFVEFRNNWVLIVIGEMENLTPYATVKYIYIFLFSWKYESSLHVGSRHGRFVVLRNNWVFIVMGLMEIWNILYYREVFLYNFVSRKYESIHHSWELSQRNRDFA